jgi:transposase
MAALSVSDGELRRLEVLRDVDRGGLPVPAAAQLLWRSERQVRRLSKAFRSAGAAGLISKKRGRPSNRRTAAAVRAAALWIVRQNYADFGPTLAAEKLAAEHGFSFSSETVRKWMIEDGLWLDRKQRHKRIHQPRPRRECVGELVQVDGSEHWWFEDRGPQCTLLVFVDDATSRLMHLQFVESESTFAYFHATPGATRPPAARPQQADIFKLGKSLTFGDLRGHRFCRGTVVAAVWLISARPPTRRRGGPRSRGPAGAASGARRPGGLRQGRPSAG